MPPVKKLFSGLQRKGGNLNLSGQAPYKAENWRPGRGTDPVSGQACRFKSFYQN